MASSEKNGVALVTGAASGIGKDTAFSLAESGASRIVFADHNDAGAREAAELSKKYATNPDYIATAIHVEVTDVGSVQEMVRYTKSKYHRIDYSVHSAGIGSDSSSPVSSVSLEEFDQVLNVNFRGTLICNRAVLEAMSSQETRVFEERHGVRDIGRGSIVNVGSLHSLGPLPGKVPYIASKHGVSAISKTTALETVGLGIRVNLICPSWVVSAMTDAAKAKDPHLDDFVKAMVPSGRMAMADDVSDTIVFLCSPASSYINGQAVVIENWFNSYRPPRLNDKPNVRVKLVDSRDG